MKIILTKLLIMFVGLTASLSAQAATWNQTSSPGSFSQKREVSLSFFRGYLYVGGENGLRRSNDAGVTWQQLPAPSPLQVSNFNGAVATWSIVNFKGRALFVSYNGRVARSVDGLKFSDVTPMAGNFGHIHSIAVAGSWIFISTDFGWFRSRSGNSSTAWSSLASSLPDEMMGQYSTLYSSGITGFMQKSTDFGVTWQATTMPDSSGLFTDGPAVFGFSRASTSGEIVKYKGSISSSLGDTNLSSGSINCCSPIVTVGSLVLAGGNGNKVSILRQGTSQWSALNSGLSSVSAVFSFAVDRSKCKVFAGTDIGVWAVTLDPIDCTQCTGSSC